MSVSQSCRHRQPLGLRIVHSPPSLRFAVVVVDVVACIVHRFALAHTTATTAVIVTIVVIVRIISLCQNHCCCNSKLHLNGCIVCAATVSPHRFVRCCILANVGDISRIQLIKRCVNVLPLCCMHKQSLTQTHTHTRT